MKDFNGLQEAKKELRRKMLTLRDGMPPEERAAKDAAIAEHFWQLPEVNEARSIMFYLSMGSEVATDGLVQRALKEKVVAVPVTVKAERRLLPVRLNNLEDTVTGTFNVREPRCKEPISLDSIDVVVVPGIAFDENCYRLGYGGGYYDRFLPTVRAFRAALAYHAQVLPELPIGETDVPADLIVTEFGIIRRKFPSR